MSADSAEKLDNRLLATLVANVADVFLHFRSSSSVQVRKLPAQRTRQHRQVGGGTTQTGGLKDPRGAPGIVASSLSSDLRKRPKFWSLLEDDTRALLVEVGEEEVMRIRLGLLKIDVQVAQ
eukprot:3379659-Prymnesium_polylepis.2